MGAAQNLQSIILLGSDALRCVGIHAPTYKQLGAPKDAQMQE